MRSEILKITFLVNGQENSLMDGIRNCVVMKEHIHWFLIRPIVKKERCTARLPPCTPYQPNGTQIVKAKSKNCDSKFCNIQKVLFRT